MIKRLQSTLKFKKTIILKVDYRTSVFVLLLRKLKPAVAERNGTGNLFPFYFCRAAFTLCRSDLSKHHQAFEKQFLTTKAFLSGIRCFESRFSFLTNKHTATEITPVKPHTHSPTGTSCHCGKKRQIHFNTESLFKKHSLCLPTYFLIAFESSANDVKVPRSSSANTMQKHSFFSAVPSVLFFFH